MSDENIEIQPVNEEPEVISQDIEEKAEPINEIEPIEQVKKTLKEKVQCDKCGKTVSQHALKYTHKCKGEPQPKRQSKKKNDIVQEPVEENEDSIEELAEKVIHKKETTSMKENEVVINDNDDMAQLIELLKRSETQKRHRRQEKYKSLASQAFN